MKESTTNSFNMVKEASHNTKSSVILSSKKTGSAILLFSKKASTAIKNAVNFKKKEDEIEVDEKDEEEDDCDEKQIKPWYSFIVRPGSKDGKQKTVDSEIAEVIPARETQDEDGEVDEVGDEEKKSRPWYSVLGRFGPRNDKPKPDENELVTSRSTAATINTEVAAAESQEAGPEEPHLVGMVGAGNDVTTDLIDEPEKMNMVRLVFSRNPDLWKFFDGIKIMPKKNEEEELVVLEDKKEGFLGRIFK